jgi:hypothetical protein
LSAQCKVPKLHTHRISKLNWVETGFDSLLNFSIDKQTMPNTCKYFPVIDQQDIFSFTSWIMQIGWKLKEIPYLAMSIIPNNAKYDLKWQANNVSPYDKLNKTNQPRSEQDTVFWWWNK